MFLLSLIVGGGSVWAQSWTASEVGAGDFVLYNVGAGQYFISGNGWGSQASITSNGSAASARTITIEAYDGNYKLRTNQNGDGNGVEHLDGGTIYNDQSRKKNSTWTFTQVGTDNGPIYTIMSAANHGGGSGVYMTANSSNTIVGPGADASTAYAQWKLLDAAKVPLLAVIDNYNSVKATVVAWTTSPNVTEATAATATFNTALEAADAKVTAATTVAEVNEAIADLKAAGNTFLENVIIAGGIDITNAWITNPAPGISGNLTGWTNSGSPGLQYQLYEYWNVSGGTTKQTLANLPKGAYKLSAIAYTRDNMTAYLNAGENKVKLVGCGSVNDRNQGNNWIAQGNGNGVNELNFTLNEATESLEIGLKADDSTGDHWMCWRSFSLTYYGDPINLGKATLAEAVAAAEATEGTIPTAAYNAISAVVTANNKSYASVDEYEDAAAAINTAVGTYASAAIVTGYARYNTIKAAVLAISSNVATTEADAAVEAATTAEPIEAAIATLRAALLTELPNVSVPEDPGYIDVTAAMVDNASVSQNTNYWTAVENGSAKTSGSWAVCNYNECEFYNQNFKFYQTLALNRGTWEFGVTGFHRAGNHSTYFYAGDDKILIPGVGSDVVNTMAAAKDYFDGGNGKVALKFVIESAQDVEIGINNQDTQTDKWTIFRDFTLKYYGAPDYSVYDTQWSEAVDAANEALEAQAYKYVSGSEKTAVTDAIADAPDGSSKANYLEKIQALEAATATFKAAAPSYNAWVLAKTKTKELWGSALGVADPTTAAEAAAGVNALNVAEYNKVNTEYSYPLTTVIGDFTSWTRTAKYTDAQGEHDDTPQTNSNQHWSGEESVYYEQGKAGWGASNGFNCTYTKIATLPAGNYVIKVAARASGSVTGTISATATDKTVALPNVGASSKGIDLSGAANFGEGEFANGGVGYGWEWRFLPFTLAEDGEVTLTINASTTATHNWFSLADAVLLSDSEKFIPATAEDYTALNTAIEAAAAHTLGFEDGEYAPYNNIEALATLAAAQTIDQNAQNTQEDVQAATAAINALKWVANDGEVNAVYDGTFANAENDGAPAGWTMSNNTLGGSYHSRAFVGDERLAEFNETNSAFFIRFDGTNSDRGTLYYYGNTEGYTMPLKANTRYYVKADVKGWGSTGKPQRMNIGGPAGFSSKNAEVTLSNNADNDDAAPQQLFIAFTTTVAGNYTINFQCPGSDSNKHNAVVSNIELKKVPQLALNDEDGCDEAVAYADVTVTRTIKAGAWNSFTVPFDMDVPEGWTVKELTDAVDFGKYLKLEFEDAEAIKAGVPYMVKLDGEDIVTEFEAEGVSVSPTLNNVVIEDVATMKGNMAPTTVPTGAFFISNNTWYEAAEAQPVNIKAFRAYIELSEEATARGIMGIFSDLEGDVTGINSVNATEKKFDGTVYDLSGRKVAQPARGLYIVNGKKVVIK